jgi:hypothetical protein
MIVCDFPSLEKCKEFIMDDAYVSGKVWDRNRIDILEYKIVGKS